jgi:hypothetical protein
MESNESRGFDAQANIQAREITEDKRRAAGYVILHSQQFTKTHLPELKGIHAMDNGINVVSDAVSRR